MTNEVIKAKVNWQNELATIIDYIIEKYPTDNACIECEPDNEMFKTSCQYVALKHELCKLKETLKYQAYFLEILSIKSQE